MKKIMIHQYRKNLGTPPTLPLCVPCVTQCCNIAFLLPYCWGPFFFVFVDLLTGGEGSTAAAVTLDTVADGSRNKMADGVEWSPSRRCSRDRKICCYWDAFNTTFLLACFCALVPTFRFSLLFFLTSSCIPVCLSSSCPFVCVAAICYSQQVRTPKYLIIRVPSACVICTLPHIESFVFIRLVFFYS